MKFFRYFLFLGLVLTVSIGYSQTKGLIYKPAGNALGKSVLDPNGDGYTSLTTAGFGATDYGSASELNMVTLPIIGAEPTGDLTTGGSGGAMDIVSVGENTNQSCYILYKTVGGINYLVIRFRLGGSSTAAKGYSLLIDTDGTFGSQYSDPKNPGYEKEIVLNTGSANSVRINTFSGANGAITSFVDFSNEDYTQRSVAVTSVGGNSDYFYDFFIPYASLGLTTEPVRIAAATISSAGSGITGTKADYNGVNDELYGNDATAIANALIAAFPPTSLTSLTEGASFASPKTSSPAVSGGITSSNTSISGTSTEANGTQIQVYKNGIALGSVVTVTSNTWSLTGVSGLTAGDLITAKATASSKTISDASASVEVTGVQTCYTPAPTSLTRPGSRAIAGTYAHANGNSIVASTVRIRLYSQVNDGNTVSYSEISPASSIFVLTDGTWSFPTGLSTPIFNETSIVATATFALCVSTYSVVSKKSAGQVGTITATPTMVTTQIIASPTVSRSVQVTNTDATASYLMLYVNGAQVAISPTTVALNASYTFNYTGFIEGDIVTARAQSATVDYWISNPTSDLIVIASATVTSTPVISGTYVAGSGKTVSGTSTESAGTIIYLYNGATLLGSTTVDAYGNWSISGLTLAAADSLTATAKATGETVSASSAPVTVAASAPAAPTVSGTSYVTGATSVSGTGGLGSGFTVTVYADGSPIGIIENAPASWTLSSIDSGQLYKGAAITATSTNESTGVESNLSNSVPVIGVTSFCITNTDGSPITAKQSGQTFDIKITAMDGPNCTGSVFTGFNGTVALSSSTSMLLGGGTTGVFVNGVLASYSVALGTPGTGFTLTAINAEDPSTTGTATLNVSASVWKGTTSTDFNTASNWTGGFVPLSGADIAYDVAADNDCYLDQNRTVAGINFNSTDKKFNLNGKTLTVSGAISGNGSSSGLFTGGINSNLEFTGTGAAGTFYMDQTTLGTSNRLQNLTLNRSASGSVSVGNPLNVKGVLTVAQGTFNTGDQVTLKSDATTTAIVGPVTGTINGKVTVERFIPARRAFRFLSSPVTTVTSIRENWQEGVNNSTTSANQNPNPGFGTHITGSTTGSNGFDATQTTNASMFTFNNSTGAWGSSIANTNTNTLEAGVPYRLMIRGDRSINLNTNTPTPTNTTLRATGTLYTGTKTITDLSTVLDGYSLIGNPYQSPVDMNQVLQASTNLNNVFYYLWDPRVNTRGGYVSVNVGTGVKSNGASSANQYLQPWQACFVKTSGNGAASVSFQEIFKQDSNDNVDVFRAASPLANLKLKLYEANAFSSKGNVADALLIEFASANSNDVNAYDANKFTNIDENFATNNNGTLLSIESRDLPKTDEIISLHTNQYRNSNYTIVAEGTNLDGLTPSLYDQYTQTYTAIPVNGSVAYNYSVITSDVQSVSSSRFQIVFDQKALGIDPINVLSATKLFPNPTNDGSFMISSATGVQEMEIEMYNLLGQKIDCTVLSVDGNNYKIDISKNTIKGVYWVKMRQNGQTLTKKLIIN